MFYLTKDGFSFLVMGYTGEKAGEFKEMFINEFNRRGELLNDPDYIVQKAMAIMAEKNKALENQLLHKDEILKLQEKELKVSAPKVQYYDKVMNAPTLIQTNVIAKELGMNAVTLNRKLNEMGVIYKSGKTWVLYSKYEGLGYTGSRTFPYTNSHGEDESTVHTYWTQKGREFIFGLFGRV